MELVFVGDACCDHSPSSGYHQICSLFPDAGWLSERELAAGRVTWYREPAGPASSPDLFHVFYGDFSPAPGILRAMFPGACVVVSVHRPIHRIESDPRGRASLRACDGIIIVSEVQARPLGELGLAAPLHLIPHGVWTQAFRPTSPAPNYPCRDVLLVGNHLRDWETAVRVMDQLADAGVRSVVVGASRPNDLGRADGLVDVRQRLSEPELADLYHRSAAFFLPLLEATASNALLEAMAAGCPVVCSRLPSLVDEYLGDSTDSFPPTQCDVATARLMAYVDDAERRAATSLALVTRAETFEWSRLRQRFIAAYRQTVGRSTGPAAASPGAADYLGKPVGSSGGGGIT